MKKWIVLALIACIAGTVQAGEKGKKKQAGKKAVTETNTVVAAKTEAEPKAAAGKDKPVSKEQFLANQKKNAEKKGLEFDQAKAEAQFDKKDKNKDGVLTGSEKSKGKGKDKDKNAGTDAGKQTAADKDKGKQKGKDKGKAEATTE